MNTHPRQFLRMPQTRPGKWSLELIIAMPILFLIGTWSMNTFYPAVQSGNTILKDILARPALALSMLAGLTVGVLAGVTGFAAILKQKERTLVVYLSTILGVMVFLFVLGEILFPH